MIIHSAWPFDSMAESFMQSAWDFCARTMIFWIRVSGDESSIKSDASWMNSRLHYFVGAVTIASIFVAAWRLATTRKWEHLGELTKSLATLLATSILTGTLTILALQAGDGFSEKMLYGAVSGGGVLWSLVFANGSAAAVSAGVIAAFGGATAMWPAILIGAALLLVIQFIQVGLLLFRNAMVVLICGVIPIAASATNTQIGKQWFDKSIAWLVAYLLYKPAAAVIYALAFRMISNFSSLFDFIQAVMLMIAAIFMLPALMRLVAYQTTPVTGVNPTQVLATGVGMAMGAQMMRGMTAAAGGAAMGNPQGGTNNPFTGGPTGTGGGAPTGNVPGATNPNPAGTQNAPSPMSNAAGSPASTGKTGATVDPGAPSPGNATPAGSQSGAPGAPGAPGNNGAPGQNGSPGSSGPTGNSNPPKQPGEDW